ncbi:MAG: RNA polymerase sigma factor [Planctomycetota bacterium]
MLLVVISLFITVFIGIFSYLVGIFTKVTFEKHIYNYYTTTRYIAGKPGKPCHSPHWHYLLWQRTLFCPIFGHVRSTLISGKNRSDRTILLQLFSKIGKICIRYLTCGGYRKLRQTVEYKTRHLVVLAKDGDESALNKLWAVYGPRVLWLVRLRMGKELRSKLESMDLVQDVLVSALKDLGNFTYKNEGDLVRWLSRIADNRVRDNLDRLHAHKRDIRKEVALGGCESTTDGSLLGAPGLLDTTTPSAIMSRREDLARLEKAIDALKPEYGEVIVLTKIEGLSCKEIADKLGRSTDAVRKLASRAMTALIGAYEEI